MSMARGPARNERIPDHAVHIESAMLMLTILIVLLCGVGLGVHTVVLDIKKSCWFLCRKCGYDLRGGPGDQCPECASPITGNASWNVFRYLLVLDPGVPPLLHRSLVLCALTLVVPILTILCDPISRIIIIVSSAILGVGLMSLAVFYIVQFGFALCHVALCIKMCSAAAKPPALAAGVVCGVIVAIVDSIAIHKLILWFTVGE